MGESVAEATLTVWLKEVGDTVALDEPVFEIATDKVDSEVPSEVEGVLTEKLFEVDDVVKVGQIVAIIETEGGDLSTTDKIAQPKTTEAEQAAEHENKAVAGKIEREAANYSKEIEVNYQSSATATTKADNANENDASNAVYKAAQQAQQRVEHAKSALKSSAGLPDSTTSTSDRFYSPLVKNIAREEGISMAQLDTIEGTGLEARVTKNDLLNYIRQSASSSSQAENNSHTDQSEHKVEMVAPDVSNLLEPQSLQGINQSKDSDQLQRSLIADEILPMTRMGKIIAKHMTQSVSTAAHVQSFIEVDVTSLVNWRNKVKKTFETQEGEKLTFTPIFMEAVAKALKKYPMMNISLRGDNIIKKKAINIGMAAALPDGNLIVPVIKNADQLNLVGMAKTVNDLADRSRGNRLRPDEVQDGTYTVTNIGSFGSVFGTPIINQPQVGILALGAIRKLPAVIETEDGDFLGIRSKMFLSHSYDHRVVNGALGSMFVKAVADYLENWNVDREL